MERDELMRKLNERAAYKIIQNRCKTLAKTEFKNIKTEFLMRASIGLHGMPMGYFLVEKIADIKDDYPFLSKFYWIDVLGDVSEEFDDKWDVYHNALDRGYPWEIFSKEEIQLIVRCDEHFNFKTRLRRLVNPDGIHIGHYRYKKR